MNDENQINGESENRVHHPYSPSTLQTIEVCACYEGRDESHIRAIAGTKAHKVTETQIDDNDLSDEDAEAAAECLDFYFQRKQLMEDARKAAVGKWTLQYNIVPASELAEKYERADKAIPQIFEMQETYLPIDDLTFVDGNSPVVATTAGYFDRAIIDHTGKYCEAFDWKFGVWPVEKTKNNLQAISYVLGLFKKFSSLERIRFWFKQPAIGVVDSHEFLRDEIPSLYLRVSVVVARAREARAKADFATANPTIPGCLFCKHIGTCPSVTSFACRVGSKFSPLKIPDSVTPTMIQDEKNTGLGMQLAQVMKVWSEAFRQVTADRVLRGAPLPVGYELRQREGSRSVIDTEGFRKAALNYLTEQEYQNALDISLGSVEKAIGDKTPRGHKKEKVQEFKTVLDTMGVVERGSPAVFLQANKE